MSGFLNSTVASSENFLNVLSSVNGKGGTGAKEQPRRPAGRPASAAQQGGPPLERPDVEAWLDGYFTRALPEAGLAGAPAADECD